MKEKEARQQIIDGREIMLTSLVPLCAVWGAWHCEPTNGRGNIW